MHWVDEMSLNIDQAVMETNVQLYGFLNWLKGEIVSFQKLLKLLKSCLQVYRYTNEGYG